MTRKILYTAVPVILAMLIGLGVLVSDYLSDVRFYKPIKLTLSEKLTGTTRFSMFGVTPKGRVLPFPLSNNQMFFHGYAFFREVGIVAGEKEPGGYGRILLSIGKQSYIIHPAGLANSWKMIRGEKAGIKDRVVLLLPGSFYTGDSKFIIFLSIIHWSVVQKMILVLCALFLILLSVLYVGKIVRFILVIRSKFIRFFNVQNCKVMRYDSHHLKNFIKLLPIHFKKLSKPGNAISTGKRGYNRINMVILIHALSGIIITCCLLWPGFWHGDALNSYISAVSGKFASGQPVFIAFVCSLTSRILPGTLPVFMLCISLWFFGFAMMTFRFIHHRFSATLLFFALSLWPILFANMGVIQTETLQLAVLAVFIPLTLRFYDKPSKYRRAGFLLLSLLLCSFSLIRYETLPVTVILAYWLCFSFTRKHRLKTVVIAVLLVASFSMAGYMLDMALHFDRNSKGRMRNALLMTDIALISADSKVNYIPDYFWQPYILPQEKNLDKIIHRPKGYENKVHMYFFNIDPSIGIFTFNTTEHNSGLLKTWFAVVSKHPLLYLKNRLKCFYSFLVNSDFNAGINGGLMGSGQNNSSLAIEKTDQVELFLKKYSDRFNYKNGNLVLFNDDKPVTGDEKKNLLLLVNKKRESDVTWMIWYSSIPHKIYNKRNHITENYVNPFFEFFKTRLSLLCYPLSYLICLFFVFFLYKRLKNNFLRFSFLILCTCGMINIVMRFVILTEPDYRYGLISILFLFFAVILLLSGNKETYNNTER